MIPSNADILWAFHAFLVTYSSRALRTSAPEAKALGGNFPKIWVGVCGALLETITLFQTKICDFPCPISDLTQDLIPYFRPDSNPISFA